MATNIEIEAKALLNEEEFEKVKKHFHASAFKKYSQTNYYIDTPDFKLRKAGMGLRIREKGGEFQLTLKSPLAEGLLEKTVIITEEDYEKMAKENVFPTNNLETFIKMLGFHIEDLKILASLTTERIDIPFQEGTFSIDKNSYANKVDYEIELEWPSLSKAKEALKEICEESKVHYQDNTKSKAARALAEVK